LDRIHHQLFERAIAHSQRLPSDVAERQELFPATLNLIAEMKHLYGHNDIVVALGAQYALEKQALGMIVGVAAGFSDIMNRKSEYFAVHLKQEPEHHEKMRQCLGRYLRGTDDIVRAESGARVLLDALNVYWTSLDERSKSPAERVPITDGANEAITFENNLLTALVNRLSKQPGSKTHDLTYLETRNIEQVGQFVNVLHDLLHHLARTIRREFRVYLAVPVDGTNMFKVVMSRSLGQDDWQLGAEAGYDSSIQAAFRSRRPMFLNDVRTASQEQNQYVCDERAVASIPIVFNDFGGTGEDECLAVLGVSSPHAGSLDPHIVELSQRFGTYLGVLMRYHLEGGRGLQRRLFALRKHMLRAVSAMSHRHGSGFVSPKATTPGGKITKRNARASSEEQVPDIGD
jgi:hypothetical protein